jgi:hypothetical protein
MIRENHSIAEGCAKRRFKDGIVLKNRHFKDGIVSFSKGVINPKVKMPDGGWNYE